MHLDKTNDGRVTYQSFAEVFKELIESKEEEFVDTLARSNEEVDLDKAKIMSDSNKHGGNDDKNESSDINTNELTDMDRENDQGQTGMSDFRGKDDVLL